MATARWPRVPCGRPLPEGGLGDAVLAAFTGDPDPLTVVNLAVTEMPTSGRPAELLAAAGIDATAIAATVRIARRGTSRMLTAAVKTVLDPSGG